MSHPKYYTGTREWYRNTKLHRKAWYRDGVLHRTDGPALVSCCATNQWWINGNRIPDNLIPVMESDWILLILKYT